VGLYTKSTSTNTPPSPTSNANIARTPIYNNHELTRISYLVAPEYAKKRRGQSVRGGSYTKSASTTTTTSTSTSTTTTTTTTTTTSSTSTSTRTVRLLLVVLSSNSG